MKRAMDASSINFTAGQPVIVAPPMTPMARHNGTIVRKAKHGWLVRFDAWGMILTETMPERCISAVGEGGQA